MVALLVQMKRREVREVSPTCSAFEDLRAIVYLRGKCKNSIKI